MPEPTLSGTAGALFVSEVAGAWLGALTLNPPLEPLSPTEGPAALGCPPVVTRSPHLGGGAPSPTWLGLRTCAQGRPGGRASRRAEAGPAAPPRFYL